jgi:hypothetical protein
MGINWRFSAALLCFFVTLLVHSRDALATIYRCGKDPNLVTLTNQKPTRKDCEKMVLPPPDKRAKQDKVNQNKVANQAANSGGTQSRKEIDKEISKKANRDAALSERGRIISEELELERSRLDAATARVTALEKIPKLSAEQQKELLSYQKKQGLHQANIDLLQKELKKQ